VFWTQLMDSMYMYLLDASITMLNCNLKIWLNSNKHLSLLCRPTYAFNSYSFNDGSACETRTAVQEPMFIIQ